MRWIWVLVAITLLGGALRAREALSPDARQSADERSYVAVAIGLADTGRYGKRSLHWPPGAPVAFAAAAKLSGDVERGPAPDIPAAYWVQWLAGTALIPLVFALALAAAGETRTAARAGAQRRRSRPRRSPPRRGGPSSPGLSPRGSSRRIRRSSRRPGTCSPSRSGRCGSPPRLLALARRRFALAGLLLAAAVLTRANLLVLIPVVAVMLGRRGGWFAVAALVPVVAWSINVGAPVTTGGGSSLFVGTFVPGGGTLTGTKRALKAETIRFAPELRGRHAKELPGDRVLDAVAARRPGLDRDAALRDAALHNLATYPRERPLRFAGMVALEAPAALAAPIPRRHAHAPARCGCGTRCSCWSRSPA